MIHYFNPGHEAAVLNTSPYYMPPETVLKMQQDLAFLPAWYGDTGDFVLVPNAMDHSYHAFLKEHFPHLPVALAPENLTACKQEEILFWGISPKAIHYVEKLRRTLGVSLQIPEWKDEYRYLNSREAARDCLLTLQQRLPEIPRRLTPVFCKSIEDVEKTIAQTNVPLVAKSPYSSSGRGLLWLHRCLQNKEREVLNGILKKQNYVSIEQVLHKKVDFSMQFLSDGEGKMYFQGYSIFATNQKGAYLGTYLYSQEDTLGILSRYLPPDSFEKVKELLLPILQAKYASLYKGCIGVDMMVYEENGELHIHPCLEINMRYNMGYLGIRLFNHWICTSSKGFFRIDFHAGEGECCDIHRQMKEQYPLRVRNGKINEGYLSLCPVSKENRYMAYLRVEGSFKKNNSK